MTIVDLINRSKSLIVQHMNALEIIEEIKRLPEDERGKVVEFMRKDRSSKVRYADDEAARAAAEAVFDEPPGVVPQVGTMSDPIF